MLNLTKSLSHTNKLIENKNIEERINSFNEYFELDIKKYNKNLRVLDDINSILPDLDEDILIKIMPDLYKMRTLITNQKERMKQKRENWLSVQKLTENIILDVDSII